MWNAKTAGRNPLIYAGGPGLGGLPSMFAAAFTLLLSCLLNAGLVDSFIPIGEMHRWGFRQGIQVAVHPVAIGTRGDSGPRGLLRIGYPILPDGRHALLNFIAVEPTVGGKKGFSELERSADGRPGKLISPTAVRRERRDGRDLLRVSLEVERFENGADVRLEMTFDSSRPDEVELRAYAEQNSAPMEDCILTATMGNYQRLRRVYLAGRVVESARVFAGYAGSGFTRHYVARVGQLVKDHRGDVVVPATGDEFDPQIAQESLPPALWWRYPGSNVTQYWKAPRGTYSPELELRLNGRFTYWMSKTKIPGGISLENFELRDRFRSGQPYVFGITPQAPERLYGPASGLDDDEMAWLAGWE
jgi:hypothetical protein